MQRNPRRAAEQLDQVDRVLLAELRADARASYAQLARQVGLSPPSVQDRVRRLERRGVLRGYLAVVGAEEAGLPVSALVSIYQTDSAERDEVATRLGKIDQIEDCWAVAGDEAFVVKVRVADVAALEAAIASIQRTKGVARTRTTVVLSTRWEARPVPLPEEPTA